MTMAIFEIVLIAIVAGLIILCVIFYFKSVKLADERRKLLEEAFDNFDNLESTSRHLAEQLQVLHAQLDLICELSPAFLLCYDYVRKTFFISEIGRAQLNLSQNAEQTQFEALIHADDKFIYEEITSASAENARKADVAASPYILRLRQNERENEYGEYLARLKPVYDSNGISVALVIALIDTAHLRK